VPDPVERVVVLRIFGSADAGMSQRAIAKMRLSQGIHSRDGGRFAQSSIGQMLSNVLYSGRIRHGEAVLSGKHEAIVSVDLSERVNAARASKPRRKGGRPPVGLHLLTRPPRSQAGLRPVRSARGWCRHPGRPRSGQGQASPRALG